MVFLWWIPAIGFSAAIYWSSSQSQPPGIDLSADYLMHFFAFGLYSWTIILGITVGFQRQLTLYKIVAAFLIVTAYGLLDEFHQSFVPGRTASFQDVLADALGALVFLLVAVLVLRRFRSEEGRS
jgi:VanZ family protein